MTERSEDNPATDPRSMEDPATWLDRYGDYLYTYAMQRVQDTAMAEDLVQDTFVSALGARKNFKGRSTVKTWLTGILRHKIFDLYRKKYREMPASKPDTLEISMEDSFTPPGKWQHKPAPWSVDPHKIYEDKEFMQHLNRCLSEISGRLAHIFALREIEGESTENICKVLNITATNSWVMLYRARASIRKCLEAIWSGKAA